MFKIEKLTQCINYTDEEEQYLDSLKPYNGEKWKINVQKMVKIKERIKSELDNLQKKRCAYCGLDYTATSGSEIEHIAPKGGKVRAIHPEFMFTPLNLVLSCHYCNSRSKKGEKDTIVNKNVNYEYCEFNIVHPYLDDPVTHYEWVGKDQKIIIKYKSDKGKTSIEMFALDDEAHNMARAREEFYRRMCVENSSLVDEILSYK